MAQKKKKQHYVPQFYLNAWSIPESHQTYVYDKETDSCRVNNITDVAMENGFYDVVPEDVISKEVLDWFCEKGIPVKQGQSQGLEDGFAEVIEKEFSEILHTIIQRAHEATPWHIKNCFFLSEEWKAELIVHLSLQFVRTKSMRKSFQEASDCLNQALVDMGAPSSMVEESMVSEVEAKNMHVQTLLDIDYLSMIAAAFSRLSWILGINRTAIKLYTSDNPIVTYAHINHPILSMSGINSEGVEVLFPITPDIVLIMVDGSFHKDCVPYERRYLEITNEQTIERYNGTIALQAERTVISADGNFSLLQRMKAKQADVFKQPHTSLRYGGKVYQPRNKQENEG